MTPWIVWVLLCGGLNLVRLKGRSAWFAVAAVLVLLAVKILGGASEVSWSRWGAAAGVAAALLLAWEHCALSEVRSRATVGLLLFLGGAVSLAFLLPVVIPAASSPWLWLAAVLLLAEPANRILRWSMGLVGKEQVGKNEVVGRGEAIGTLERWITLAMIAHGDYAALAFILAAKALARHKRFELEPKFAEYFLVGTLGSVLAAIVVAEGIRLITAVP